MPRGLKRHQEARDLHFITFSCYHRQPLLATPRAMHQFEVALELSRVLHDFYVTGYVVMPEHVHLLISEPQRGTVASAVQAIKQSVPAGSLAVGSTSGRRAITISMFGRRRSASRNYATFIGIPSSADLWRSRKTGRGAAFGIM
jgi:hypothetical protein